MYDQATGRLLDFVNLGPFVSSNTFIPAPYTPLTGQSFFATTGANDVSGLSAGLLYQIQYAENNVLPQLTGSLSPKSPNQSHFPDNDFVFGSGFNPTNMFNETLTWVANDPLVHYTVDDLTWPGGYISNQITTAIELTEQLSN